MTKTSIKNGFFAIGRGFKKTSKLPAKGIKAVREFQSNRKQLNKIAGDLATELKQMNDASDLLDIARGLEDQARENYIKARSIRSIAKSL